MGSSTVRVQNVIDYAAAKGIPVPTNSAPGGYGSELAIKLCNDVMADLVAERFNWKWNRATAKAFLTNSFQQDYPQTAQGQGVSSAGLKNIGWLEDCDRLDINNTAVPKPLRNINVRRQLSRTSQLWAPVSDICWMYNKDLSFGTYPGPGTVYHPLLLGQQNPPTNFIDKNGNLLVLSVFGTTATAQPGPFTTADQTEGFLVNDGSCQWMVVSPFSQGFRVNPLPGASGPVFQITPYYQKDPPVLTTLQDLLDPIPDNNSRFFQDGFETYCLQSSPNPGDRGRFIDAREEWLSSLEKIRRQGDKEMNAYAMLPSTSPVEDVYGYRRNPQDPSQPY